MPELPSGTVTLLFTDIEGSTRLLRQLGDHYQDVLAEHRRLMREAFDAHGGQEMGTEGDSFFVVFRRAKDAVAAAAQAQRALTECDWPDGAELRVRMGLHTGEPVVAEENYVGLGVHRAARIMSAGHGGQVLLSQATRELLIDDPPPDVSLRDLGAHLLKDFDAPERIYQLVVPGLPETFPPLKTVEAQPDTATRFDEQEVAEAVAALAARDRLRKRALLLIGVAAAVILAVVLAVFVFGGGGGALASVDANAVGLLTASGSKIAGEVEVGASPAGVAAGDGSIWVTNFDDQTISRVDSDTRVVTQTIQVGSGPSGVAYGGGSVWIANNLDGTVSRIDPKANRVVQVLKVGYGPNGVATGERSVWVANTAERTVSRIDPTSGKVTATISVSAGATDLAVGNGSIWVANELDGTVSRIDAQTNTVTATVRVGDGPRGVAVGKNVVWVTNEFSDNVDRINAAKAEVVKTLALGNRPSGILVAGKKVWVAVRASGKGHRGGTLTVLLGRVPFNSIDPAHGVTFGAGAFISLTNDGLVAFKRAGGSEGTQLVPDLAVALPAPAQGGQTYTFQLRPSLRYSTGRPVKASDFRYSIERLFKGGSPAIPYYTGIAGAQACLANPRRCNFAAGIVTDDGARTITFRLVRPDPDFLYKLALTSAVALPSGTPNRDTATRPLPATGPYKIAVFNPKRELRLVRNPKFREWSRAARPDGYPDRIVVRFGVSRQTAVTLVERSKADYLLDTLPSSRLAEVESQYANQVHVNPFTATFIFFLNSRVPPFNDIRVRRAFNYAIDRATVVSTQGGPLIARRTCQVLPPNFPGSKPYSPSTLGPNASGTWNAPDLDTARQLVAASGTQGMKVTVWTRPLIAQTARVALPTLRRLGYKPAFRVLPDSRYFTAVNDSDRRAQIGIYAWVATYPQPSDFFFTPLSCRAFVPHSPFNGNVAQFCTPRIDEMMGRALQVQATDPHAGNELWAKVDRAVVDQAAWAPIYNLNLVNFVSKRVGNYQYSPAHGLLIDQLWVK